MVLDAYQRPVLAYTDVSGTALALAYCDNPACTSWVTNKVDDANTGEYASVQLNADGLPVVSYKRDNQLYIAFCGTPACEPGTTTVKALDNRVGIQNYPVSMQLDADGRPIVSYSRSTLTAGTSGMWVAYCNDVDCDSVNLKHVESGTGTTFTSMQLNSSGNPVIAYAANAMSRGAALVTCTAPDCSTFNGPVALHAATQTGMHISLQLAPNGSPVAVFYWNSAPGIRVARCSDAACSSVTSQSISGTNYATYTSLAMNGNLPVFTSADVDSDQLKLTRCSNASCSSQNTTTLDNTRTFRTSLVLDCANNPVVAYYAVTASDVKLAVENSNSCATTPQPKFSVSTAAPGPLEFTGAVGDSPQLTLDIRNLVHATDLDVDVSSISAGYSVVGWLPVSNLGPQDPAVTLTVECDTLPQSPGTLVLSTSDPSQATVTYNLTCEAPASSGSSGSTGTSASEGAGLSASSPIAASGSTTVQLSRLWVSIPASAIPAGQTNCQAQVNESGTSAAFGFGLDDAVYDVKVVCDSGELTLFFDALTICIRPGDNVTSDKTLYHSHAGGSFAPLRGGSGPAGFVCGQTRLLSLFTLGQVNLPATGFAPGVVSQLAAQPAALAYESTALTLSIPKLGLDMDILGVPQGPNSWDVSWLAPTQAGYLHGTAFPTWQGNSVLTAHVWNADNTPGPFHALKDLQHGDQFRIQAYGQTYTYEVRSNRLVAEGNLGLLSPSEHSQITLITCESFDPASGEYRFRRAVQAVLVGVE